MKAVSGCFLCSKLGDPCHVPNVQSLTSSAVSLSLQDLPHYLGLTSPESQLSSTPQFLFEMGGVRKIKSFPRLPGTQKTRDRLIGDSDQVGVFTRDRPPQFTCGCLHALHFTCPPTAAEGSGVLRMGSKAVPTPYLSFFPLWFQVTWDRQEGVQGTPRAGPLACQGVWARQGPYLVLDLS